MSQIDVDTDKALQEAAEAAGKAAPQKPVVNEVHTTPSGESKTTPTPSNIEYNGTMLTPKEVDERLTRADAIAEANRILVSGHATDEQKEQALYTNLTNAGHTPEEARSVIQSLGGQAEGGEVDPNEEPEVVDQVARGQASDAAKQTVELALDLVLDAAFSSPTGELKSLLDANKRLNPEGTKAFHEDVHNGLKRALLREARDHARKVGRFEPRSFRTLLPKAVGAIVGAYRTAIGDLDKLGRSPETDPGGMDNVTEVKEPEPPKLNHHTDIGQVDAVMSKYTDGMLEYLAATTSTDGKTRV